MTVALTGTISANGGVKVAVVIKYGYEYQSIKIQWTVAKRRQVKIELVKGWN
jgi:hypothetical protein